MSNGVSAKFVELRAENFSYSKTWVLAFLCGTCEQLAVFDTSVTAKKRMSRAVFCRAQLCGSICTSGWRAPVDQIWAATTGASCLRCRVRCNVCVYRPVGVWQKNCQSCFFPSSLFSVPLRYIIVHHKSVQFLKAKEASSFYNWIPRQELMGNMFELIISNMLNRQYVYLVQKQNSMKRSILNSPVPPLVAF